MPNDDRRDSTRRPVGTSPRLRDQPSLTTSSGGVWLVVGGLFAAIAVLVLLPMLALEPDGIAEFAIVSVLVLYGGIVVARVTAPHGRLRLGIMAACMLAMAFLALLAVIVIAATPPAAGP